MNEIGERIRRARKAAGLSQAELADAVHVSQATVSSWEGGSHGPSHENFEEIAKAVGRSPGWLAFGEKDETGRAKPAAAALCAPKDARTIAFQGVPGAFSHLACRTAYPDLEVVPCRTFEDAFAAVQEGRADRAMIPIENALGGRVADIHHLLPDSNLYIVDEFFQPVRHYLLGVPGAKLEKLRSIRSHEQALAQCRGVIRELKLNAVVAADTAGAAKEVAELGDPTAAAIASSLAGEIYGLEVLRARIEDKLGNVTRFVVMSRRREEPDPKAGPCITSLIFQVRSVPAALYKALGGFATNGVNIVRLESYISEAMSGVAQFYIDIEGHPSDKAIDHAFDELHFFSTKVKVIGVYPAHPFRREG
jgi:prephenate dehydratase